MHTRARYGRTAGGSSSVAIVPASSLRAGRTEDNNSFLFAARGNFDPQVEGSQSAKVETSTEIPDGPTCFGTAQEILRDQEDAFTGDGEGVPRDPLLGHDRTDITLLRSEFAEFRARATEA